MCFNITPIRATRDIKCYKGLTPFRGDYRAPSQGFIYKKRGTYTVPGFGYTNSKSVDANTRPNQIINTINEGFHSFIRRVNASGYGSVTVECTIPKGAYYWKNDDQYCSTAIKIGKRVKRR